MEKQADGNIGNFVTRRTAQLRVLSRLLEHELSAAKGAEVTLDRSLAENVLDTLEIFIDDFDVARGGKAQARSSGTVEQKPQVTRLN